MAYNMHQGYYEQDKVCYSEQDGYGRSGYGMPHLHHHNQAAGWTDKVTECETYSAAGYNNGGYAATPFLGNQHGISGYERKEEMCMSTQSGGFHRRGTGFHRRRVMRRSVSRGEYSSSESDSD